MKKLELGAAIIVALIFLQTLFFKFTGAPESVWIFSTLGVEPWGRILSGVFELVTCVLLLVPRTRHFGALMGAGIMAGAIVSHLAILGIEVQGDGGLLFALAAVCFGGCVFILSRNVKLFSKLIPPILLLLVPHIALGKVSYNAEKTLGVHGYDPVSYITEGSAKEGQKTIHADHDGITYLFASESNKAAFLKDPQKFLPAYGGWCAYAMADNEKVDIDPKTFKVIDGKTYLFYNGFWGNTLQKWNVDEKKLKKNADAHWTKLLE